MATKTDRRGCVVLIACFLGAALPAGVFSVQPTAAAVPPGPNGHRSRSAVTHPVSIETLLAQLAGDDFTVRQLAVRELITLGRPAIQPVVQAAAGGDLEIGARALKVLLGIGRAGDDETAIEAVVALETLAASEHHHLARRATEALRRYRRFLGTSLVRRVLTVGGSVVVRPERGSPFAVSRVADLPMASFVVTSIDLRGATNVTAETVADLGTPQHVEQLLADGAPLDDACVQAVCRWPALEHLYLERTRITPVALESIGRVKHLHTLWLSGTVVSNDALRHLAGLSSLRSLDLEATDVGDAGLAYLAGLEELAELNLRGTRVGDAGMARLAKLPRLQSLSLEDTKVGDAGLRELGALATLQFVDVRGTSVTATAVSRLKERHSDLVIRITPGR